MPRRPLLALALAAALPALGAADPPRSGKQVVDEVCSGCHAAGLHGAPRIGDRLEWITRARRGVDELVASAIRGHGEMPARGGVAALFDGEMRAAVGFMLQESLGAGAPMNAARAAFPARSGKDVVMWRCARCHEQGLYGAPRIGHGPAWEPRLKNGMEAMVRAAIVGHDAMPARGGVADLTDQEMHSASAYLTGRYTIGR